VDASEKRKLERLVTAGRELLEKLGAVLDEADVVIGGGAGIGQQLRTFEDAFDAGWGQVYAAGETGRYVWNYRRDRPNTKRLLKTFGLMGLTERAVAYLEDRDPFLTKERHPFGLFVARINRYAAVLPAHEDDADIRSTQQRLREQRR
jgi:hypothetical protein